MLVRAFRRTPLSVESVWEVLQDHEGMTDWAPGITARLDRAGLAERNGVGAIRLIESPWVRIREEITAYEPQRRLAYRAIGGIPLRGYQAEVILERTGSTTGVTWTLACDNTFPALRFVLRAFAGMLLFAMLRATKRCSPIRD